MVIVRTAVLILNAGYAEMVWLIPNGENWVVKVFREELVARYATTPSTLCRYLPAYLHEM
jgi:hypothetical protein